MNEYLEKGTSLIISTNFNPVLHPLITPQTVLRDPFLILVIQSLPKKAVSLGTSKGHFVISGYGNRLLRGLQPLKRSCMVIYIIHLTQGIK
jgi:hypothetical protein